MPQKSSPILSDETKHAFHAPDNTRIYAIGDVHGYLNALQAMQDAISNDLVTRPFNGTVHIIYMGDYIDRGPDSKNVIAFLIGRKERQDGIEKSFLLGNHEVSSLKFANGSNHTQAQNWLKWGGYETLASYDVELTNPATPTEIETAQKSFANKMPHAHKAFIENCDLMVKQRDYIFAHAGIDPEKPIDQQKTGHLLSIREPFLNWDKPLPFCVVHGHTISDEPEITPHRIGIDTGYYKTNTLTAAVLEQNTVRFLQI